VRGQFFQHAQTKDGLFGRMVHDVEPDQAGVQIPVIKTVLGGIFQWTIKSLAGREMVGTGQCGAAYVS
jgi:hypothetical protein